MHRRVACMLKTFNSKRNLLFFLPMHSDLDNPKRVCGWSLVVILNMWLLIPLWGWSVGRWGMGMTVVCLWAGPYLSLCLSSVGNIKSNRICLPKQQNGQSRWRPFSVPIREHCWEMRPTSPSPESQACSFCPSTSLFTRPSTLRAGPGGPH